MARRHANGVHGILNIINFWFAEGCGNKLDITQQFILKVFTAREAYFGRVFLQSFKLLCQFFRMPAIVRVQKGDPFSSRSSNAGISGSANPPVFLADESNLVAKFP